MPSAALGHGAMQRTCAYGLLRAVKDKKGETPVGVPPEKSWRPGLAVLARVIEGQGVEMVEKVHILHMHMVRGLDARRGEIEDGGDARVHQVLGRTLGAFGRRGDDADLDVLLGHHGLEVLGAVHFQAVDDLTDLEGVAVEDAHDVEAAGAEFTVEVCNNGNDDSPTWEDVTQAVNSGSKFFLSNETKTAESWGFNFRIKVKRNGASGDCFISSVGGNFE